MTSRKNRWFKVLAPWFSAGILLQTTTCTVNDVQAYASGLLTTIATDFVSGLVFSAFNLAP